MIAYTQILAPVDFGETADAALNHAKTLCDVFKGRLHLLHVVEDPYAVGLASEVYVAPPPTLRDDLEKDAQDRLKRTLTGEERERYHARLVVAHGSPFVEIVRYAKQNAVDLIVLGTHGRGPIAHMLLGSVAEKVVRKAPCPVLTVRIPGHEFVMP